MISKSKLALFTILASTLQNCFADLVKPESPAYVELSSRDTNRFVCTNGPINDVFFSEEKGIQVKIEGPNVYVKFSVRSSGMSQTYVTAESEFFITCAGETYSIIAKPNSQISAKTHRLGNPYKQALEANKTLFGPMSVEERAVKATEIVFKGDEDTLRRVDRADGLRFWREDIVPGAVVSNHAIYEVDGFGLIVQEFRVEALQDIESLQEIQFLNPILSDKILAITVVPHELKKGETARVIIVEKEANL